MASNYSEKKNDYKTSVTKPQPNVGPSREQEGAQNQEGSGHNVWWSREYNCLVINGVLAPVPISYIPPETGSEDEPQSASPQGESSRRKRTKEGSDELSFELFKFRRDGEEYLLEMHEVKTGKIERCHVQVYESNGKWKVEVHDLRQGNHDVFPMLEDPTPLVFQKKYELSLQERLIEWTVEKRKRGNGKEDKFYYHRRRQFRSFVEVTAYILYSCNLKALKLASTTNTSQNVLAKEVEAVEAMMTISSSGADTSVGLSAGKEA